MVLCTNSSSVETVSLCPEGRLDLRCRSAQGWLQDHQDSPVGRLCDMMPVETEWVPWFKDDSSHQKQGNPKKIPKNPMISHHIHHEIWDNWQFFCQLFPANLEVLRLWSTCGSCPVHRIWTLSFWLVTRWLNSGSGSFFMGRQRGHRLYPQETGALDGNMVRDFWRNFKDRKHEETIHDLTHFVIIFCLGTSEVNSVNPRKKSILWLHFAG